MANLIITIISIALVAVAAVMGAYYGDGVYSIAGQGLRQYRRDLPRGEQITDSWAVYASDNGGSYTLANLSVLSTTSASTQRQPVFDDRAAAAGGRDAGGFHLDARQPVRYLRRDQHR